MDDQLCKFAILFRRGLLLETFVIILLIISVSSVNGLEYGMDCKPMDEMDSQILQEMEKITSFRNSSIPIFALRPNEWTLEMENFYVLELLKQPSRCNVAELLKCNMKLNENTYDINFHHHPLHNKPKKNAGQFELRIANLEPGSLEFDTMRELEPEWRCVCNPDISIHKSFINFSENIDGPSVFVDTCMVKVGFPCKLKSSNEVNRSQIVPNLTMPFANGNNKHDEAVYFKLEYPCVLNAECTILEIFTTTNESESREGAVQSAIEKVIGYEMSMNGMREAYVNHVLRHTTHVCQCVTGFTVNGNGVCVRGGEEQNLEERKATGTARTLNLNDAALRIGLIFFATSIYYENAN